MLTSKTDQPHDAEPRFFYGYVIVVVAFIIQMAMFGPGISFGVFFKPMIAEFGWTRALISGAFSLSKIIQGLSSAVMGGLNDRFGPRVVLASCGILLGVGYLLLSRIGSAWQFYLFYVLFIGLGMGGLLSPQMSTVARWFVARRSVMTGIVISGGGIAGIIAPPIVNWLITAYGWRDSYVILGAFVLVIITVTAQFLRRDPAQMGQEPYGKNKGSGLDLNLVAEGLSFREATQTRQFWMLVIMLFSFGFCGNTILVHIVPHITDLGISSATAASILAIMNVPVLISSIVLGGVADRIGNKRSFVISFILMSAALLFLNKATDVWMLYLVSIIFGFGVGGATALESPLVADLFGMRSHGLIFGMAVFCQTIGSATGSFIPGYVFDISGSYQLAFIFSVALGVIGLIMAWALRPVEKTGIKF